MKYHSSS